MGQRELWRFLGIHFNVSSGNVEGLTLSLSMLELAVTSASSLAVKTEAGFAWSDRVTRQLSTNLIPRASSRSCFPSRFSSALGSHLASPQAVIWRVSRTRFLWAWLCCSSSNMARSWDSWPGSVASPPTRFQILGCRRSPGTGATATRCHARGQETWGGWKHSAVMGVLQSCVSCVIPNMESGRGGDSLGQECAVACGLGATAKVEHG